MADFDYVEWTAKTPLSDDRLFQMSENDQHLKDLIDTLPKGILGWSRRTTNRSLSEATVGDWFDTANLEVDVDVGENRLIKVTYRCQSISGGSASGVRTLGARIIMDDTTVFATCNGQVEQNYTRAFPAVVGVRLATSGTRNFKVQHRIEAGTITGATFNGTTTAPHQLIVEDIGVYVDPQ